MAPGSPAIASSIEKPQLTGMDKYHVGRIRKRRFWRVLCKTTKLFYNATIMPSPHRISPDKIGPSALEIAAKAQNEYARGSIHQPVPLIVLCARATSKIALVRQRPPLLGEALPRGAEPFPDTDLTPEALAAYLTRPLLPLCIENESIRGVRGLIVDDPDLAALDVIPGALEGSRHQAYVPFGAEVEGEPPLVDARWAYRGNAATSIHLSSLPDKEQEAHVTAVFRALKSFRM
jgi:hypothetical protein